MTADQEHKLGTRAAVLIILVLCGLCVLASLSGCKITYRTLPKCACERRDM
jgi:hypothetical protein